jgi:hypothetical protein
MPKVRWVRSAIVLIIALLLCTGTYLMAQTCYQKCMNVTCFKHSSQGTFFCVKYYPDACPNAYAGLWTKDAAAGYYCTEASGTIEAWLCGSDCTLDCAPYYPGTATGCYGCLGKSTFGRTLCSKTP